MNILLTGGAGYIGSHTTYELIRDGHSVIILDNLSTGNKQVVHPQAKFYEEDQLDKNVMKKIFSENNFDVVMYFSAKLIVPKSVEQPLVYFENNVYGLGLILEVMKEYGVKNIVFSLTAAVYGDQNLDTLKEDSPKEPFTPYGTSKLSCERLIQGAAKAYKMNYVIFRYFNVAGADAFGEIGQSTKSRELTHLIPVVIESASGIRKNMSIFGNDYKTKDGTCVRDYIHVSDLAKAHVFGAKYAFNGKSNIFNLGSNNGFSVQEIVNSVESTPALKVPYNVEGRRDCDPAKLVASNDRALKELHWSPSFDLDIMIKSDYLWRNNNFFS
ncbi:UDP-glucose 4-epimerase GalE [Candidatus Mycoplasma mahonii]|uniref:UDP-glucose 4-epimerase GalE n=1 Tax=Candidatus Mycoplasma mahonii TaxID=3004105 RepID=UPI0026F26023|nr:UDP-glucose 4-epimerase GalE [Candidatus Mycoplasma mahonii]WKX02600.1 UDP-glucose 4-epimerase GalE [Candidatus Mycoplasma mahonii]